MSELTQTLMWHGWSAVGKLKRAAIFYLLIDFIYVLAKIVFHLPPYLWTCDTTVAVGCRLDDEDSSKNVIRSIYEYLYLYIIYYKLYFQYFSTHLYISTVLF